MEPSETERGTSGTGPGTSEMGMGALETAARNAMEMGSGNASEMESAAWTSDASAKRAAWASPYLAGYR